MKLRPSKRFLIFNKAFLSAIGILFATGFFCEYLIYYVVQYKCSWPKLEQNNDENAATLKAMFIADTHLLGPFRGHWFDKLRREWQMHRAYSAAVELASPDLVFFLGDIFDEGQWVNDMQFAEYVTRFHRLFPPKSSNQHQIIVGNHDIGFHYMATENLQRRFDAAFNQPSTELKIFKNVSFVLVNSIAMEDDGCHLCVSAQRKLETISRKIKRSGQRPILLQHFPLYRESDETCEGDDSAPEDEKHKLFRPKWDCLSESSTKWLLDKLNPRLVLSGHTHHGCVYHHGTVPEYSVASFSWRNRNNPNYLLVEFSEKDFAIAKCFIPQETTVIVLYKIAGLMSFVCLISPLLSCCSLKRDRHKIN